jgi:NAD-dependent SIR2 family protein deacetylase
MMPACQHCGSFVTRQYVRVFTPEETDGPQVCPHCEDRVRGRADVRETRTSSQ